MASLENYRGLLVIDEDPVGAGGLAIQNDLKSLADWSPKSLWSQSADPDGDDNNSANFFAGSLWLRTDTTPPRLFICQSASNVDATWIPVLLNVEQDASPKLGGNLDLDGHSIPDVVNSDPAPTLDGDLNVNGHKITDAATVELDIGGTSIAIVSSSGMQIQGNVLIGTSTVPTGATFNTILGGGSTSPVLGPATADIVSMAAVDRAAGDRRLYIQSEIGAEISLGNDRLNFAATAPAVSVGGTDVLNLTSGGIGVNAVPGVYAANIYKSGATSFMNVETGMTGSNGSVRMANPNRAWVMGVRGDLSNYYAFADSTAGAIRFVLDTAGNLLAGGTTATPANATFNLVLSGGVTTPVLGSNTADTISIAAVDAVPGDRRLYIRSEIGSPISLGNDHLNFAASTGIISIGGTDTVSLSAAAITLTDAVNIIVGSSTGTKFGTGTGQKLGFWNATPVAQYAATGTTAGFTAGSGTAANSDSTYTGDVGSSAYTVGDIVAALKKCGIMAN